VLEDPATAIIGKIFGPTKPGNRLSVRLVGNGLTRVMQFIGPFDLLPVLRQEAGFGFGVDFAASLLKCPM
jgi:hypothetical protein